MKLLFSLLFSLILILQFPNTATAHAGRTDASGGHIDSGTGKYHYHHGYPAHNHYDLDGNGTIDCPYDFDDKTNREGTAGSSNGSGSSEYSGSYTDGYKAGSQHGYEDGYNDGYNAGEKSGFDSGQRSGYSEAERVLQKDYEAKLAQERKDSASDAYWMCAVLGVPAAVFFGGIIMDKREKKLLSDSQKKMQAHTESVRAKYNTAVIDTVLGKSNSNKSIPSDVDLQLSFVPIKGNATELYPFGDYTVFVTNGGRCYHSKYNCSGAKISKHCFSIPKDFSPCRNCIHDSNSYQIPDWYISLTGAHTVHDASSLGGEKNHSAPNPKPAKKKVPVVGPNPASGIREMRFSEDAFIITFGDGKKYLYFNVPKYLGTMFAQTDNCLLFFKEQIDGVYPYMFVPD